MYNIVGIHILQYTMTNSHVVHTLIERRETNMETIFVIEKQRNQRGVDGVKKG